MSVLSRSSNESRNRDLLESVRWLLLAASRFVCGPSFQSQDDIRELARSSIASMRCGKANPKLFAAASVAISSVLENANQIAIGDIFDERAVEAIFAGIAPLAGLGTEDSHRTLACQSAGNLTVNGGTHSSGLHSCQ